MIQSAVPEATVMDATQTTVHEATRPSGPLVDCQPCREVVEPIRLRTRAAILAGRRAGVFAIRQAMHRIDRHRDAFTEAERPAVAARLAYWRWRVLRLGATEWQS